MIVQLHAIHSICVKNERLRFIDAPRNVIRAVLIIAVNLLTHATLFQHLPTFLLSLSFFLPRVTHERFSFSLPVWPRSPMEVSRGFAKSRPDWSSAEASRSGRFGVLKARRAARVISFATSAIECDRRR